MGVTELFPGFMYRFPDNGAPPTADSYILGAFAAERRLGTCLDLCSGAGMLSFLLLARGAVSECSCLDIDPSSVDFCRINAAQLATPETVKAFCGNACDCLSFFGGQKFDTCICNPPYHTESTGASFARTENICTLDQIVKAGASVLRQGGRFFISMKVSRLPEMLSVLSVAGVEPKRLMLTAHSADKKPFLAVCEGIKGAAPGLTVRPLLTLYGADGLPTEASNRIYYGGWQSAVLKQF